MPSQFMIGKLSGCAFMMMIVLVCRTLGKRPDSVSVSEWCFKSRSFGADADQPDQHRPVSDDASSIRTGHEPHQSHSDNDTASVAAAAVSSVAVTDRDATGSAMYVG